MENVILPSLETQIVVDLLVKRLGPCTIFAFGYLNTITSVSGLLPTQLHSETTQHHFDILVLSAKAFPNGASNLANAIAEQSGKTITVSVLLHKVTDLATKQASQQWFFDQVFRYGERLSLDTTASPYLLNHRPTRNIEGDRIYWFKCVGVAQFHLNAATESEQLEVALCKIALLHTACEQIALGLLRVFLGYTPNEFGLKYLLQLCGSFTDLPSQLFHQQTPEAIQRYKMLCAPLGMLHHWTRLTAPEQDFDWLLDACEVFLKQANAIALIELERLEDTFNPLGVIQVFSFKHLET
ncbi:MAG: hypothetical protein PHC28_03455 [Flavobacterium sp.]|uniref:hypothetical protein n=1 Tax=Flavobacterium sp. TaxID=239 RepID=UPI00262FE16C|nr:hypothetical protein [Flavobacterium sp.]MDD5149525.1 hypothetical protein [Flavobacterium sp.]